MALEERQTWHALGWSARAFKRYCLTCISSIETDVKMLVLGAPCVLGLTVAAY